MNEWYIFLSRDLIRKQWDQIIRNLYNPRPDIETADEFIHVIEEEGMIIGGAIVVLQDKLSL